MAGILEIRRTRGGNWVAGMALAAAALAVRTGTVQATGNLVSGTTLTIQVQSGDESGEFTVDAAEGQFDEAGVWSWHLPETVDILSDDGATVATLEHGTVFIDPDPVVTLNFSLSNPSGVPGLFIVSSPLVSFATIPQAIGRASASLGITDLNGNLATLTGGYAGGTRAYIANFNGFAPGGTNFATLAGNLAAGPFNSVSTSEELPPVGFIGIADPVSSISSQFRFTLSAGDSASGTSTFAVIPVPEPGTLSLLGFAGVALLRRRRRN